MNDGNTIDLSPQRRRENSLEVSDSRLESLIGACANGAESAFEQLYNSTSSQLFGVLKRILKSDALAEEALQDAYVKIWNHAERYDGGRSAPRTWLVSIARNQAIDLLRKRRSREDVELNLDNVSMDFMPDNGQPMDQQHESSQLLDLCLQQLSEPARECVVRAYCEGFSQEELSERLQRPIGTIKSWIRRSLVSLKECLDGHA